MIRLIIQAHLILLFSVFVITIKADTNNIVMSSYNHSTQSFSKKTTKPESMYFVIHSFSGKLGFEEKNAVMDFTWDKESTSESIWFQTLKTYGLDKEICTKDCFSMHYAVSHYEHDYYKNGTNVSSIKINLNSNDDAELRCTLTGKRDSYSYSSQVSDIFYHNNVFPYHNYSGLYKCEDIEMGHWFGVSYREKND